MHHRQRPHRTARTFRLSLIILAYFCVLAFSADPAFSQDQPSDERVESGIMPNGVRWIKPKLHPINGLAFSPDGSTYVTCAGFFPLSLQVWDAKSHQLLHTTGARWLIGCDHDPAFSPDGKTLAVASSDEIVLFDTQSFQKRQSLRLEPGYDVDELVYSRRGNQLAAATAHSAVVDKTKAAASLQLWSATGENLRKISLPRMPIRMSFSADEKQFAVAQYDSPEVAIRDVESGELVRTLVGHTGNCQVVKFSPDGKRLATGAKDGGVLGPEGLDQLDVLRLWNAETGQAEQTLLGHQDDVKDLAFSADGKWLASVGREGFLFLWEMPSGKKYGPLKGHKGELTAVAFSPDSKTILTGGFDGLRVWDLEQVLKQPNAYQVLGDEKESWLAYWHGGWVHLALSPDGKTLVTHNKPHWLGIWDYATRQLRHKIPTKEYVVLDGFSADGRQVVVHDETDGEILFYDAQTGEKSRVIRKRVSAVLFPHDGNMLLVAEDNVLNRAQEMFGLKVADGEELFSWKVDESEIEVVHLSPDRKLVATVGDAGRLKLWRVADQQLVRHFNDDREHIRGLCFSPDGKQLAARNNKTVRVWSIESGMLVSEAPAEGSFAKGAMLYLRDQTTLAVAHRNTISLIDSATGKVLRALKGYMVNDEIISLALTPNGRTLISSHSAGKVKFWDVAE